MRCNCVQCKMLKLQFSGYFFDHCAKRRSRHAWYSLTKNSQQQSMKSWVNNVHEAAFFAVCIFCVFGFPFAPAILIKCYQIRVCDLFNWNVQLKYVWFSPNKTQSEAMQTQCFSSKLSNCIHEKWIETVRDEIKIHLERNDAYRTNVRVLLKHENTWNTEHTVYNMRTRSRHTRCVHNVPCRIYQHFSFVFTLRTPASVHRGSVSRHGNSTFCHGK